MTSGWLIIQHVLPFSMERHHWTKALDPLLSVPPFALSVWNKTLIILDLGRDPSVNCVKRWSKLVLKSQHSRTNIAVVLIYESFNSLAIITAYEFYGVKIVKISIIAYFCTGHWLEIAFRVRCPWASGTFLKLFWELLAFPNEINLFKEMRSSSTRK